MSSGRPSSAGTPGHAALTEGKAEPPGSWPPPPIESGAHPEWCLMPAHAKRSWPAWLSPANLPGSRGRENDVLREGVEGAGGPDGMSAPPGDSSSRSRRRETSDIGLVIEREVNAKEGSPSARWCQRRHADVSHTASRHHVTRPPVAGHPYGFSRVHRHRAYAAETHHPTALGRSLAGRARAPISAPRSGRPPRPRSRRS